MTPGEYAYFDKYQGMPDKQPEAIGGFLPIERVYPTTRYRIALTPKRRPGCGASGQPVGRVYRDRSAYGIHDLAPFAGDGRSGMDNPERKSWEDFRQRVNREIPILQERGYNPYTLSREPFITLSRDTVNRATAVTFTTERYPVEIRYSTDGSEPGMGSERYTDPIRVTDSTVVSARLFQAGEPLGDVVSQRVDYHRAIGKEVLYNTPFSRYYPAGARRRWWMGYPVDRRMAMGAGRASWSRSWISW